MKTSSTTSPHDASPPGDRRAAAMLALAVFVTTYGLVHALAWPAFVYLPELRTWALSAEPGSIAMSYFGLLAMALLTASTAYAVGRTRWFVRAAGSVTVRRTLVLACQILVPLVLLYLAVEELWSWAG